TETVVHSSLFLHYPAANLGLALLNRSSAKTSKSDCGPAGAVVRARKRFARTNPARNDKLHRSGLLFAVQGCCIVTQTSHFRRLLDTSGWPGLGLIARWMVVLVAGTLLGAYAVVAT